ASVIPERQRWLRKMPWALAGWYVLGLGTFGTIAIAYLLEHFGFCPLPWAADTLYEWQLKVVYPIWATLPLLLLARQAVRYPEAQGRQQAGLVAAGLLPWTLWIYLTAAGQLDRWVPMHWQEVIFGSLLLLFPIAVYVILLREARSQEQILLSLTDEVQHV